ncbi:phosphoribosylamine--glycine ligase [Aerococcaceae bacterium DSM 111176]|nr:phosphoribosylamine--glycine ligase [Aerococcaceae bacterium DSM 111176]
MKVLIIGSGGREHALGWKLDQSPQVDELFFAPGNAGTSFLGTNVLINAMEIDQLVEFAKSEAIDLTVVGPEDPLCAGIVERFEEEGLKIFGPNLECSQFESSKDFTKKFLQRHEIPTAAYNTYTDYDSAVKGLGEVSYPIVIKADGLALGKGVVIVSDYDHGVQTLDEMMNQAQFGEAGATVVIEEFLDGPELSLLCIVSHNRVIPLDLARDYKKAYDGDQGLNTGGVGCFSPVPIPDDVEQSINEINKMIEQGLIEDGFDFTGILFVGFIIQDGKPYVLEFNVRFGDPETEVLMPRLESDLFDILNKAIDDTLIDEDLIWSNDKAVGVILTSIGYPAEYEQGHAIKLPVANPVGTILFHNGTAFDGDNLVNAGGRVLTAVGLGKTQEEARLLAYQLVGRIESDNLTYRTDIAK